MATCGRGTHGRGNDEPGRPGRHRRPAHGSRGAGVPHGRTSSRARGRRGAARRGSRPELASSAGSSRKNSGSVSRRTLGERRGAGWAVRTSGWTVTAVRSPTPASSPQSCAPRRLRKHRVGVSEIGSESRDRGRVRYARNLDPTSEDWLPSLATAPGVRADPGAGVSEGAIVAAEAGLGVASRSYRAWLRAYNDTWIGEGTSSTRPPTTSGGSSTSPGPRSAVRCSSSRTTSRVAEGSQRSTSSGSTASWRDGSSKLGRR